MKRLVAALGRTWAAWVRLWSIHEIGTSLAWFRIALGMVTAYALLSMIAADLVEVMWVDVEHGGMQPLDASHWLVGVLGGRTPTVAWTLVTSGLALSALLVLGVGGRITVLCTLQVYYALTTALPVFAGGYDTMITNALWILVFARSTATWSLDCKLRTGGWTSLRPVPAWPRYLLILQLVVIYANTGLFKLSPVWTPGGDHSALYWVFQEPTWRRFDMVWTADWFWVTQLSSAVTWWWEVTALLLLLVYYFRYTRERDGRLRRWFNRFDLRKPWAAVGVGLHLGIMVLINVGPFSPISLAYYLCLITPQAGSPPDPADPEGEDRDPA